MDKINFNIENGFSYHWSGRFIAPNENWIHMTRELVDYNWYQVLCLLLIIGGIIAHIAITKKEA